MIDAGAILTPQIDVSDSGTPANDATCEVMIHLFDFQSTVDIILIGMIDNFQSDVLEQLLTNILELDLTITNFDQLNATHYFVQIYGQDGGVFIPAGILNSRLLNLTREELMRLEGEGFLIVGSNSNAPVVPPTNVIPTRTIPVWAVAVIVVLNSVIIITVLLIIVGVLWRRYSR